MSDFQGTFKRYEKKYLLNKEKYHLLRDRLNDKLMIDNYGETTICNIYFDTPDHYLVRTSLEKPVYKEKLRLRSYGTPRCEQDIVFVELKKKYKGIVYKKREKMELSQAKHYLYELEPVSKPTQITYEIDWLLKFYREIGPSMYISYNRIAMYSIEDSALRVTFDRNILWREDNLFLERGSFGDSLLKDGYRLMEIKIPGVMPLWFSHILDELEIYPISFSKYGIAYQQSKQLTKENNEGEKKYA